VGGEAAAAAAIPSPASLVGDVVAVTAAPPLAITLGDPATSTVTTPPAAATVSPAAATMLLPMAVAPPAAATVPPPAAAGEPSCSAANVGVLQVPPTPPDARAVFFDKIVQRTTGLLPVPAVSKHGSKSLPPRVCLRRSRRLAGAEADVVPTDMGGRVQKKAMRSLGIINEHEGINQQAQNDYAKLFGQPLSDSHLQALTALFFWSLPEELEPGSDDVLMVKV